MLNVPEAAERLGLAPATLRQWIWRRKIEVVRVGRSVRIRPEVIEKIITRGTVPALERE